ncbi:MAG: cyclodeaminase/cyclohydrolase family protein [Peptococcaceae bacterium]|jgi:formiminotetrahydrofolate cyclodeaminase|nr:cyclodeaminase/cyclohydrolase family protein [Peptococcaceae bacterium]
MNVWQWTTAEFLSRAASAEPVPGGGSVAAYSGAAAAAMVCMVANLTLGKEKYRDAAEQTARILKEGQARLRTLQDLVSRDIEVFTEFMAVLRLPKTTDEEKSLRAAKMQETLRAATEVPLAIARDSLSVLQLARELAPIGNQAAISDAGAAAYLAESALKAALLSAQINLKSLQDAAYVQRIQTERFTLLEQAAQLGAATIAIVESRL